MQSTCAERCQVCLRERGSLRCTVWRSPLFLCLVVPFPPRSFFSVVVCSFALLCFLVFLRPRLSLVGRGGVRGSPPLPARSASGRPADPAPIPSGWRPPLRVGSLAAWSGFRGSVLACSPGGSRARVPRGCGPGRRLVGPSVFGWGSLFLSFCRSSSWRRLCSSASRRLTCRACLDCCGRPLCFPLGSGRPFGFVPPSVSACGKVLRGSACFLGDHAFLPLVVRANQVSAWSI